MKQTAPRDDYEGLTVRVEANVVDLTYYGPKATSNSGGGILKTVANMAIKSDEEPSKLPQPGKALVLSRSKFGQQTDGYYADFADSRIMFIATYGDVNTKARSFHLAYNHILKKILGNRTSVTITGETVVKLKEHMAQFNVGKVVRVRITVRAFSKTAVKGYHPIKGGNGSCSLTQTLYTCYFPYSSEGNCCEDAKLAFKNIFDTILNKDVSVDRKSADIVTITAIPNPNKANVGRKLPNKYKLDSSTLTDVTIGFDDVEYKATPIMLGSDLPPIPNMDSFNF